MCSGPSEASIVRRYPRTRCSRPSEASRVRRHPRTRVSELGVGTHSMATGFAFHARTGARRARRGMPHDLDRSCQRELEQLDTFDVLYDLLALQAARDVECGCGFSGHMERLRALVQLQRVYHRLQLAAVREGTAEICLSRLKSAHHVARTRYWRRRSERRRRRGRGRRSVVRGQ